MPAPRRGAANDKKRVIFATRECDSAAARQHTNAPTRQLTPQQRLDAAARHCGRATTRQRGTTEQHGSATMRQHDTAARKRSNGALPISATRQCVRAKTRYCGDTTTDQCADTLANAATTPRCNNASLQQHGSAIRHFVNTPFRQWTIATMRPTATPPAITPPHASRMPHSISAHSPWK